MTDAGYTDARWASSPGPARQDGALLPARFHRDDPARAAAVSSASASAASRTAIASSDPGVRPHGWLRHRARGRTMALMARRGEPGSALTSRTRMALWCGFVVVAGPALNFVRDATQEYPFYDHGAVVAVVAGVMLTVICGLVFSPALVSAIGAAGGRSRRGNLVAGAVFGASVGAAHLAGYWMAESESFGTTRWLAAYPIASALAWLSLLRVGGETRQLAPASSASRMRSRPKSNSAPKS